MSIEIYQDFVKEKIGDKIDSLFIKEILAILQENVD